MYQFVVGRSMDYKNLSVPKEKYWLFDVYSELTSIVEDRLKKGVLSGLAQKIDPVYTSPEIQDNDLRYEVRDIIMNILNEWNNSDFVFLPVAKEVLDNKIRETIKKYFGERSKVKGVENK